MPGLRRYNLIPDEFVQALVTYADLTPGGIDELKTQFTALFARINAGEGDSIVSTSVNGKSFGYEVSVTVHELFAAYGQALRELANDVTGAVVATYADFSQLRR
jgi:hypothetical protein